MAPGRIEHGLDMAWLHQLAERDPVPHVYAIWDHLTAPEKVEFVTLVEADGPSAYLVIWRGRPEAPVVHWVGAAADPEPLLAALPPRPLTAVVPEPLGGEVARRRGPAVVSSLLLMACDRPIPPDQLAPGRGRRLGRPDTALLRELARLHPNDLTAAYATADPEVQPIFGVVHDDRLAAVARITAQIPRAWIIGGVFTVPEARGRGFGREATRAAVTATVLAGARPALFVKEQNLPARRIYERLGFVARERRALVEALPLNDPPNRS